MSGITQRENSLKKVLADMGDEFDYVIVDCPPAVGLLTFNALRAATDVIVPVETGYFALHGLSRQLETLKILCERCNQQISVKVLASMYDIRTKMAREILAELRANFDDKMFRTTVNFNTKIKEASSFGQPINEYDPASKGQLDFQTLAEEVVDLQAKLQRHDLVNSLAGQLEKISSSADELLKAEKTIEKVAQAPQIEESIDIELEPIDIQPAQQTLAIEEIDEPDIAPQPQPVSIDEKLSDYYGVTQTSEAIAFVTLYPRAESVQIAGDFNNWQPAKTPLEKVGQSGVWQTEMKLPAGKYRYRLVVDGQWQQDPYNEHTEVNPFGGFNSVIEVK